ncbi:MAG: precorrin-2 C(20)-methyltransferase [Tannerellaceae bacterium]|nr:precorrin-2 C(20)-methyltransferase [Tannerellaceae bacterium]
MLHPVKFVSLGPGEAELITVKGWKALLSAQAIYCPATCLSPGKMASRGAAILAELQIEPAKIKLFPVPMSKDREAAMQAYKETAHTIRQNYQEGMQVAVAVEGDSGFYSSTHYIMDELKEQGIPVSQIGGIPAFIACEAKAGIHLVKQEEQLVVIPGRVSLDELVKEIRQDRVVVLMKTSQCEETIKQAIPALPDHTFHYFENVGLREKEFYTTDKKQIVERAFPYFSLVIIRS